MAQPTLSLGDILKICDPLDAEAEISIAQSGILPLLSAAIAALKLRLSRPRWHDKSDAWRNGYWEWYCSNDPNPYARGTTEHREWEEGQKKAEDEFYW